MTGIRHSTIISLSQVNITYTDTEKDAELHIQWRPHASAALPWSGVSVPAPHWCPVGSRRERGPIRSRGLVNHESEGRAPRQQSSSGIHAATRSQFSPQRKLLLLPPGHFCFLSSFFFLSSSSFFSVFFFSPSSDFFRSSCSVDALWPFACVQFKTVLRVSHVALA